MSSLLHITNGDHFTERLKKLDIKGDIITWREMLCEGRTLAQVGSESFWKTRFDFLHKNYQVSKSAFIEKTLKEYRNLCNHKKQDRIVLWFEYDLFCQINLVAVLSWLLANRKDAEISLVCSGNVGERKKGDTLGELTDEALLDLFAKRVVLSPDDIEFADYVWQLYCSNNPLALENLRDFDNYQFQYLAPAIKSHLKRFPSIANGLNEMEQRILKQVQENKYTDKSAFLSAILRNQATWVLAIHSMPRPSID